MEINIDLHTKIRLLPKHEFYLDKNGKLTFELNIHFLFLELTIKKN